MDRSGHDWLPAQVSGAGHWSGAEVGVSLGGGGVRGFGPTIEPKFSLTVGVLTVGAAVGALCRVSAETRRDFDCKCCANRKLNSIAIRVHTNARPSERLDCTELRSELVVFRGKTWYL